MLNIYLVVYDVVTYHGDVIHCMWGNPLDSMSPTQNGGAIKHGKRKFPINGAVSRIYPQIMLFLRLYYITRGALKDESKMNPTYLLCLS